jgi:hypothetical protein
MAKATVHWGDDLATVFGSGEMGFLGTRNRMGEKARSPRSGMIRLIFGSGFPNTEFQLRF